MLTRNKLRGGSSITSYDTNEQKYSPEKCRVCLDDGEIPIFGVNDISPDVSEFGNIEVGKDDNLPQYLCEACYTLLEAAILFRKTAKQADEVLRKPVHVENCSEDSDYKNESEPDVKREYLVLNDTSDSELDDFDRLKQERESEDETDNYPTFSETDTQESNDNKDFQIKLLKVEEEESNNDAENEMIMIIVSDKDKQNQAQPGCEKCNIPFKTFEELIQHNEKMHPIAPHNARECDICHNFVTKNSYRAHLKEHREKYKEKRDKRYAKVECKICGKYISKSYHKYHLKMHGTPEEQAERVMECPICKKTFSVHYYADHLKRVHDNKSKKNKYTFQHANIEEASPKNHKMIKCPVCDKNVNESEYKLHLAKHGGPLKRYICDKCGKVFKHPSAFKTHCLTHGSELKYKCQFCPYRGLHQGLLKVHVRTHTGDYNYKCTECPARFITKSNLSKHLQRHKGLCSYKCDICEKGFYTKRDVEKHTKNVHLQLRTHICEVCGKSFGHRDNMLSHQLKVHKREKIINKGRMPSYLKAEKMQFD